MSKYKGTVKDDSSNTIPYAIVLIYLQGTQAAWGSVEADAAGNFSIEIVKAIQDVVVDLQFKKADGTVIGWDRGVTLTEPSIAGPMTIAAIAAALAAFGYGVVKLPDQGIDGGVRDSAIVSDAGSIYYDSAVAPSGPIP